MPTGRQLVVNLPSNLVDLVQRKVASGEYADESDVISDSLALLEDQEQGLERWLREEVVPACMEMEADPSSGISSSGVLANLEAARSERQKRA
jgi:antitoxin ParD1/3/4